MLKNKKVSMRSMAVFIMLLVVMLISMNRSGTSAQAAERQMENRNNSKIIYVPEEKISVSKSVEEDTFTVFRNIRKNASWTNTDEFFNDCSTNYAFLQLENKEKSFEMKTLYIEILNALTDVYRETDKDIPLMNFSEKQLYCIGTVPYSALGLDDSETFDVFMRVLADHPLIYFAKEMLVQDGSKLYLIASEEFYKGDVRREYNNKIQSAIKGLDSGTAGIKSNYEIVKYVHDLVIGEVAYAYEEGTANPKDNGIVHSIAGYVSASKEVVCDGYAETIAAMLNYLDIETICAYGWGVKQGELTSAKTAHAWNVVKLGDGKYYGVDATWDDTESEGTYAYFCLGQKIYESHSIIRTDNGEDILFVYDMPELSADDFTGEDILLKTEDPVYTAEAEIDSVGEYQGFSYEMQQDGTIQLTGYQGNEKVVKVPSDIKGHRVVSITDCFNYDDVIEEIELPDTIYYLGFVGCYCNNLEKVTINTYNPGKAVDASFTYMSGIFGGCQKLKTIIVNENENFKTFWVEDNVMYFGDPDNITLVLYPAGKTDQNYCFKYAMEMGSSAFEGNKYIKNIIFEEKIKNPKAFDGTVNPANHVFYHCIGLESVTLQKGAPTVMVDWFDGCVSLKSFEIPDTVTKIGSMMFNGCISLKKIVIPSSVTYIESSAFQGCSSLESCTIHNDKITFEHIVIDGKEFETIWNGCNKLVLYCNRDSNTEKYARKFDITTAPIGSNEQATEGGTGTEDGEDDKKPGTGTGGDKTPATKASLKLNRTKATLYTGKASNTITVKVTTVTGTSKTVKWTSKNEKVAKVKNGKITAVGKGTTTITAIANGITKRVTVTVKDPTLTIKKGSKKVTKKLTVNKNKKVNLKVTVSPKNSGISIVKLTAKQKQIATVTFNQKKGTLTIKGKKKDSFTLKIKSGKGTRNIKITVK